MKLSSNITRRRLMTATAAATAAASGIVRVASAAEPQFPVVAELFTSQGCSSCPPADAFMKDLRDQPNVIALTLNVDYWDYLGWRDTLGSSEYSERQRQYARRRGDRSVYTPQIVLNGKTHAVGSKRDDVLDAIGVQARESRDDMIGVSLSAQNDRLYVDIAQAAPGQQFHDATIWMVMVVNEVPIEIERGENRGSRITYYNVARKFMPAGTWHGKAMQMEYNKADLMTGGHDTCCVLLQADGNGPIIGAANASLA